MTFLTIMICNRYWTTVNTIITIVKLKFGYSFEVHCTCISIWGRETKYTHTPLLELYNRKTSSFLSRLSSPEIFLEFSTVFCSHGCGETMLNVHVYASNHMSPIVIVVLAITVMIVTLMIKIVTLLLLIA